MVTAEEIGGVTIFAGLALERARAARARRRGHHARSRASTRRTRATSGRCSRLLDGRIEAVKLVDGIERIVGKRQPRRRVRRGADRARHGLPGRVPRGRGLARHADRGARLPRASPRSRPRSRARSAGSRAHRIGGSRRAAGDRGRPPPPRAIVVGHRWDAACTELRRFLDRNQVTFTWLAPDAPDAAEQWGGPLPDEDDCPASASIGRQDRASRPQLRGSPSCSASAPSRRARSTTW